MKYNFFLHNGVILSEDQKKRGKTCLTLNRMTKDRNDLAPKNRNCGEIKKYLILVQDVTFRINRDFPVDEFIITGKENFPKSKDIFCPRPFCIRLKQQTVLQDVTQKEDNKVLQVVMNYLYF
jgi:hypothetical protein